MNCDQAFECLTDPQRHADSALEDHLDRCPRCRDMAEILEPALRFVTGATSEQWSISAWEFPAKYVDRPAPPFLTEQAVGVAEEAATSLLARKRRQQRGWRNRWLAAALLAPMVALALFLSEPNESRTQQPKVLPPSRPALGPCTRASIAITARSGDADREISAYEVVRSCNVCHLLDRPAGRDEQEHLKLQPAKMRETGSLWQFVPENAHVSSRISLGWELAAVTFDQHCC